MGNYTKEQAIAIVTSCARSYKENLANKSLLLLCLNQNQQFFHIELTFDASNFLHLTGVKPRTYLDKDGIPRKLGAGEFYRRCLEKKLSVNDFDLAQDGTTKLKLDVLPMIMTKNLSAVMIGDYNSANPRLYTEKLVGGVTACVGFVQDPSKRYVPNTVLKADIRDNITTPARIIAVFRKSKSDDYYDELTYKAKKFDFSNICYPSQFAYLSSFLST